MREAHLHLRVSWQMIWARRVAAPSRMLSSISKDDIGIRNDSDIDQRRTQFLNRMLAHRSSEFVEGLVFRQWPCFVQGCSLLL
ncbi:hypothetical protein CCP4SC76_150008 [Gammaproteobacteria bacterium]